MSGQVDVNTVFNRNDPVEEMKARQAIRDTEEIKKRMSPPGALNLPHLLEQRRLEYGIMDDAFRGQAAFDRVLVWQLSQFEGETYGDTRIIMTDRERQRQMESAPRGIIISAGLLALDNLRGHGMDLGHIVSFVRLSPWRQRVAVIGGKEFYVLTMRAGDIVSSEDTAALLKAGKLVLRNLAADAGGAEHVYVSSESGRFTRPSLPNMSEDEGY